MKWLSNTGWRYLTLAIGLIFALFPILFVISAALNPLGTLSSSQLYPTGASLHNFSALLTDGRYPFGHWMLNSTLIGLLSAAISVLLSMLAAYAFSRMRFRGRRVGLGALMIIQMFPQFLAIVAIFIIFTTISDPDHWPLFGFDGPWGLILLYLGGALGVNTYLMKGFLDTVPKELDESAAIDGAGHFQTFVRIILPLVAPVLAVTALIAFIGSVNEFLFANVFLRDPDSKTLAVGMYGMIAGERNTNFGIFAAGTLLTAVPTVALFLWLQRYIVSGLTGGAVKG
jgi:arabinogalactan oligomer/maltooligosaccharide transport system permease protein